MKFISFTICLLIGFLMPIKTDSSIVGKWKGEIDNQPLIELSVRKNENKISGSVTFFKISAGQSDPSSKEEISMIDPKIEGKKLTFNIKNSDSEILKMSLELTGEKTADLIQLNYKGQSQDQPIKMEKIE